MMNKSISYFIFLLLIPISHAESVCSNSGGSSLSGYALGPLAAPFDMMMKLLTTELSVFIFMFIFFFMLMYGIFHISLSKAKAFSGAKRQLKTVAVSLSFIVNLSFFGLTSRHGGPKAVLERFLGLGELFGAIVLVTIMFLVLYYLFKKDGSSNSDWKTILLGIGIAMILVGQLICRPAWVAWGTMALFFSIVGFILNLAMNGNKGDISIPKPPTPPTPLPVDPIAPEDPKPVIPPDFSRELNEIEKLIEEYKKEFQQFTKYANDILQTHNKFMKPGGYYGSRPSPVSPEQWERLHDSLDKLNKMNYKIRSLIKSIESSPRFDEIIEEQRLKIIELTTKITENIKESQEFYVDFLDRYKNAQPPK